MSNTDQAPDPSMEEILASIRRIISDDDAPEEAMPEPVSEPVEEELDDANADIDAMLADMEAESGDKAEDAAMPEFDPAPAPEPEVEDDIFDLTDIVEDGNEEEMGDADDAEEPSGKEFIGIEDQDLCFDEPPAAIQPKPKTKPLQPQENLLSPTAAADASAAFGVLANTILTSSGNSRTLEDLVQDLLRPMLKGWLDDNLPALVERLVREEIERVARQGR